MLGLCDVLTRVLWGPAQCLAAGSLRLLPGFGIKMAGQGQQRLGKMGDRFDHLGLLVLLSLRITSVSVLPHLCSVPLLFHRPLSQLQPVPLYFALVATFIIIIIS